MMAMHTVKVPQYLSNKQLLGVFEDRMVDGLNLILCTYVLKRTGKLEFPKGVVIDKQEAIKKYGLVKIQKNSRRLGIFLSMSLFRQANEI
ncbi:MAG TPA: hypothetical protein PLW50_00945 [Smithellaceae bacterium]|nr:hypothetical protein [Smithellaceae bacterium]